MCKHDAARRLPLRVVSERPQSRRLRRVVIDLEREHQARTLRAGQELEPRLSRADEQELADQARAKREAERAVAVAELERRIAAAQDAIREIRPALVRIAGGVSGRDYRNLDQARRELDKIKRRYSSQ